MNQKRFFGLALVLFAFVAVLGCKPLPVQKDDPHTPGHGKPPPPPPPPPPPVIIRETLEPFTVSLMEELERKGKDVQKLQFFLSGRISLETESPTTSTRAVEEGGRARINVGHNRDSILIKDRLEGELMAETRDEGEIILSVCFEKDKDVNHQLNFSNRTNEPEAYFYLNYFSPGRNAPADEKGSLAYGEKTYKLRFAEKEAPYLLIKISRKETNKLDPREVPGRRVVSSSSSPRPSAASATESTLMPFTVSLMEQLEQDIDVQKLQFFLFGRISLETEFPKKTVDLDEGRGMATINVEHIRNSITFKDKLEGELMEATTTRAGETILSVCFDEDDNNWLKFSSRTNEPESYFYLDYSTSGRNAEEKGSLDYGGKPYKLRFAGEKAPYLWIRISRNEEGGLNFREAPGRKVGRTE